MLLPIRAKNPPDAFPWVTYVLIFINLFVFGLTADFRTPGWQISEPALLGGGLSMEKLHAYRFISSMFLHGDVLHLIGNLWMLYLFGCAVEGRLKWWRFFLLYILAGIAGDVLHMLISGVVNPDIPSIGASGAIMGCVGAAVYLFPFGKITFFYWFSMVFVGTFDWPMWGVGLMYFFFDMLGAFMDSATGAKGGVANLAHIGGAIGGLLLAMLARVPRDNEVVSEAKAAIAEGVDITGLSRMELAEFAERMPTDSKVAFAWMYANLGHIGTPDEKCRLHFERNLPRILAEIAPLEVGRLAVDAVAKGIPLSQRSLFDIGAHMEKTGQGQAAKVVYTQLVNAPITDGELRGAVAYRLAMVCETFFQDLEGARRYYEYFLQYWPMDAMAPSAKSRLQAIAQRLGQGPRS